MNSWGVSFPVINVEIPKCTYSIMLNGTKTISCKSKLVHKMCSNHGLFSSGSTDLKDEEEDVNNVNVERESPVDVLLWTDCQLPISNKKLGVVY